MIDHDVLHIKHIHISMLLTVYGIRQKMNQFNEKIPETNGFTLFSHGSFSNFHKSSFIDMNFCIYYQKLKPELFPTKNNGVSFVNVEQYMHATKALIFRDWETFTLIMQETHPREHKKLGRRVTPFRDDEWKAVARMVVTRGCWLNSHRTLT